MTENVSNGLTIDEKQFTSLKTKEQMAVLFTNSQTTITLVKNFKLHQKVQYTLLAIGGVALSLLFSR
jgi:hypothetical protein